MQTLWPSTEPQIATRICWRTIASLRLILAVTVCLASSVVFAAGGTSIVASKGQPAAAAAHWPEGVTEIVNDATRTFGLNSWFTEWPNDVNQYGFEIATSDDLNRLMKKLAAIKSELREIRLSPLAEPQGLGWVTNLPKGNNTAAVFSIGDQSQIDDWYKRVRKPFGVMEFLAAPVAVPPTLTIFVQNEKVKLEELQIPEGVTLTAGGVPTVFHRANTKQEKQQLAAAAEKPATQAARAGGKFDAPTQAAADRIGELLKQRKAAQDASKP